MDKKVVTIINPHIQSVSGGFRLVGRVKGHPDVADGHIAITSQILRIETLNTTYVLEKEELPNA